MTRYASSVRRRAIVACAAGALAIGAGALLQAHAASNGDIPLKAVGVQDLSGLSVGLYAPDSTLKAPVESLKAAENWPVSSMRAAINTDPGLCDDHAAEEIISLSNIEAGADGPDCIFGLMLTAQSPQRSFEIAIECGDWVDNAAPCWGFGPTGDFRLVRDKEEGPTRFRLLFPGPGTKPPPAAGTGETANQKHGLFLDTLLDEKKQAKGDLWLVWTGKTVELEFSR